MFQEEFPADLVEPGTCGRRPVEAVLPPLVMCSAKETGCARVRRLHVLLPRTDTGQAQVAVGTGDGCGGECFRVTLVAILGALRWLLQSQGLVCGGERKKGSIESTKETCV